MQRIALALAMMGAATMAEATILDTFDVPYSRSISSGTYVDTFADSSFFGGHRDIQLEVYENTGTGSIHVEIANGKLRINNDPGVIAEVRFQYDGFGELPNNTGAGKQTVAYALPGERPFGDGTDSLKVYIDDAQFQRGIGVGFNLYRDGFHANEISRNPPRGASVLTIGPNPFVFVVNNAIDLRFGLIDGGDTIVVDRAELVPEVGTIIGLMGALGALGLANGRRNS